MILKYYCLALLGPSGSVLHGPYETIGLLNAVARAVLETLEENEALLSGWGLTGPFRFMFGLFLTHFLRNRCAWAGDPEGRPSTLSGRWGR